MNAQTMRIKQLEKTLKEKEIEDKEEKAISFLLKRYPHSMDLFQKQVEQEQLDKRLKSCIHRFEIQKDHLLEEFQSNCNQLKTNYNRRFDDLFEKMMNDSLKLSES
ncbi:uncharacterized protein BX663DRAFT_497918 [Cokeromyces recurvatus]|uniref:uncharacterized protein n=1 Tax=Cokeromyces recurvatus TaxID=90255 RepID=UPI00222053EE|nr:uncharacterized protein BX663DRAFT_497918 [Cokeromyces recurvatus]KAI7905865.1 hypothetical protein BX663DRAFT_497918 [Cokeromyces recurvatus]